MENFQIYHFIISELLMTFFVFILSSAVFRHRQHPDQPGHPEPPDGGEQVCYCPHAGFTVSILQLLVWHHSTGTEVQYKSFQLGSVY